jgi:hypothetical protein
MQPLSKTFATGLLTVTAFAAVIILAALTINYVLHVLGV